VTISAQRRGPGSRADADHPTRHALLAAAALVAERDGLASLSVQEITSLAGVAKGTFYVHFADRTDMLVALHRSFHDEVFAHITDATKTLPPGRTRAEQRVTAFLDGCRRQRAIRAVLLEARTEPAIADEAQRRNAQAAALLATDLRAGGAGALASALAQLIVIAAAEVAVRELLAGRKLVPMRAALRQLLSAPVR
jgi:TetR/AcrR family transcriptional regulator, transcriptional repressor for nem operon